MHVMRWNKKRELRGQAMPNMLMIVASRSVPYRSFALSLSLVAIAVLLTGCDRAREAEFSVLKDGEDIRIVACENVSMTGLALGASSGDGSTSRTAWEIDGDLQITAGQKFEVFRVPVGMTETKLFPENLENSKSLVVFIYGDPDGVSTYDLADAKENYWIRWDGSTGLAPCP
ncbi:hypothetical protein GCM10009651_28390 [Microbacterium natoriense]